MLERDLQMLVPYNTALSVALGCNTDVALIATASHAKATMFYIFSYILKHTDTSASVMAVFASALESLEKHLPNGRGSLTPPQTITTD